MNNYISSQIHQAMFKHLCLETELHTAAVTTSNHKCHQISQDWNEENDDFLYYSIVLQTAGYFSR